MAIEEVDVIQFLNELQWPMSPQMFNALFRASPTVTFELVVLAQSVSGSKVVLLTRPDDDTEFPGMLHVPGTVMRRGDTKEKAIERLCKELPGVRLSVPEFAGFLDFPLGNGPDECSRGQIVQRVYVCRLEGGVLPEAAVLADVDKLPLEKFGWPFQRHLVARAMQYLESGR